MHIGNGNMNVSRRLMKKNKVNKLSPAAFKAKQRANRKKKGKKIVK